VPTKAWVLVAKIVLLCRRVRSVSEPGQTKFAGYAQANFGLLARCVWIEAIGFGLIRHCLFDV
jgi:hypothetical protein